jgi:hypothetical protein
MRLGTLRGERVGARRFVSFELWPPRSPESAVAMNRAAATVEVCANLGWETAKVP